MRNAGVPISVVHHVLPARTWPRRLIGCLRTGTTWSLSAAKGLCPTPPIGQLSHKAYYRAFSPAQLT
jgi:hypothetical protein